MRCLKRKQHYKRYEFNKIDHLYLADIDGSTCIFLTERGHEKLKADEDICAKDICTGYIVRYEDDDDDVENRMIYTGHNEKLPLKNFKYVTLLIDFIGALGDKEEYFA